MEKFILQEELRFNNALLEADEKKGLGAKIKEVFKKAIKFVVDVIKRLYERVKSVLSNLKDLLKNFDGQQHYVINVNKDAKNPFADHIPGIDEYARKCLINYTKFKGSSLKQIADKMDSFKSTAEQEEEVASQYSAYWSAFTDSLSDPRKILSLRLNPKRDGVLIKYATSLQFIKKHKALLDDILKTLNKFDKEADNVTSQEEISASYAIINSCKKATMEISVLTARHISQLAGKNYRAVRQARDGLNKAHDAVKVTYSQGKF